MQILSSSPRPTTLAATAVFVTLLAAGPGCDCSGGDATRTAETDGSETGSERGGRAGVEGSENDAPGTAETASEQGDDAPAPDATAGSGQTDANGQSADESARRDHRPELLHGRISPGEVTETYEAWREQLGDTDVDRSEARALREVAPGAEVTVYFATWCSDSRREVPRLWSALERAGGDVPFSVEYIAVDREFDAGDVSLAGADLEYVPTFVVDRDGEEVGRIVESAPDRLERDLHALLTGEREGVLSGRSDL